MQALESLQLNTNTKTKQKTKQTNTGSSSGSGSDDFEVWPCFPVNNTFQGGSTS